MSSGQQLFLDHVKPFFGAVVNRENISLFIDANYPTKNWNSAPNTETDSTLNPFLEAIMCAKNYKTSPFTGTNQPSGDDVHYEFVNFVSEVAKFHGSKAFFNGFIKNHLSKEWRNMPSSAKEFYNAFVVAKDKTGIVSLDKVSGSVNIELRTTSSGNSIFSTTLPYVRSGTRVWTNTTSATAATNPKYLQDHYNNIYKNTGLYTGNFSSVFSIDYNTSIKNMITSKRIGQVSMSSTTNFDDLFKEESRPQPQQKQNYSSDEEGRLYELKDGKEVRYDNNNIQEDTCAGTQLKHADKYKCTQFVYQCLLSQKGKNFGETGADANNNLRLQSCLDALQNQNMYQVADDELSKVDPSVAIEILKTFGVGKVQQGNLYRAQEYDDWERTTFTRFSPNVQNAIKSNQPLKNYLKGVINFVNSNPAILNKNQRVSGTVTTTQTSLEVTDKHLLALGMKTYFVNPLPGTKGSSLYDSSLLKAAPTFGMVSPFSPLPFMYGGGLFEDSVARKKQRGDLGARNFVALFNNVYDKLRSSGINVDDNSKTAINDGINKLGSIENKLLDLFEMYNTLSDIARFFKAAGCEPEQGDTTVTVEQLLKKRQVLDHLSANMGDLQTCINANISQQNTTCGNLIKAYADLKGTVSTGQSGGCVTVSNI